MVWEQQKKDHNLATDQVDLLPNGNGYEMCAHWQMHFLEMISAIWMTPRPILFWVFTQQRCWLLVFFTYFVVILACFYMFT